MQLAEEIHCASQINKKILYGLAIAALFVVAFLTFRSFIDGQNSPYASEIASAFLGALLTVMVTSLLLGQQSKSEEAKEKNVEIYKAKLETYKSLSPLCCLMATWLMSRPGKVVYPSDLSDAQWQIVGPVLRRAVGHSGHVPRRDVLNAIFYVLPSMCFAPDVSGAFCPRVVFPDYEGEVDKSVCS